jgi:hypothetical protein
MKDNTWIKSSFSGGAGMCVEVFRKSTFSGTGGSCVEVADLPDGGVAVRDTKLGEDSPVLKFNADEWNAFGLGMVAGEFGTFTK